MKISVIIPVYRGEKYLDPLLRSIEKQTLDIDEIWIVETEGSDFTQSRAEACGAHYIVVDPKDFDHAGTRSMVAEKAGGDILIFLTQDVLPESDQTFEKLVQGLKDNTKIAVAYGRQIPDAGAHPVSRVKRSFNYPERAMVKSYEDRRRLGLRTTFVSNACAAYRKEALSKVDYFGERLLMCEDVGAAAALLCEGHEIHYAAEAVVYHTHNLTFLSEFRRYFDIGVAHRQLRWIHTHFGGPNRDGVDYLKEGARHLIDDRALAQVPSFILRCLMGRIAYSFGRHHELLPVRLCARMSSFPRWWRREG